MSFYFAFCNVVMDGDEIEAQEGAGFSKEKRPRSDDANEASKEKRPRGQYDKFVWDSDEDECPFSQKRLEPVAAEPVAKKSVPEQQPLPDVEEDALKKKSSRGPSDCLNWESDEEEFTPFTQERPERFYAKSVAKKSSAKRGVPKKGVVKNAGFKKGSGSKKKGKSLGKCFFLILGDFFGIL